MKILVILTAYNGAKYIQEQIQSILDQVSIDVDIRIYDDVSKDDTIQVINLFSNDKRVRLLVNKTATGNAAHNFFNGIEDTSEAIFHQYDYVAFSDQDDIWLPNKLKAATDMLIKDHSSLYMSNLIMWEEKTNNKNIIKKSYPQKKYDFLFEGGSAGCTYVFTRKFCIDLKKQIELVKYKEWKFFSHDWFVYFFARINDYKVSIDSNSYILYRIHDNNVYGQLNLNSLNAIKERFKLIKKGWFFEQIKGFQTLTKDKSNEKLIYELYCRNYFTRLYVLIRYNFQLMRSSKKLLKFIIASVLTLKTKN
jgi:rhamnosyltransferase